MISVTQFGYQRLPSTPPAEPDKTAPPTPLGSKPAATPPNHAADKPFSELVLEARNRLNDGYKRLGKVADEQTPPEQWRSLGLETMDRRMLYAIASNQGGMFSEDESLVAANIMSNQLSAVMTAADPNLQDPIKGTKAFIDYLDTVSLEEKASLGWARERGTGQATYLELSKERGRQAENVDTGNPIVNLIARSYGELSKPSDRLEDMPSWRKAMDLWSLHNEERPPLTWFL